MKLMDRWLAAVLAVALAGGVAVAQDTPTDTGQDPAATEDTGNTPGGTDTAPGGSNPTTDTPSGTEGTAPASDDMPSEQGRDMTGFVIGTVEAIDTDAKTLTLREDTGASKDYKLKDDAEIFSDGNEADFGSVKVGDRVTVHLDDEREEVERLEISGDDAGETGELP